MNDNGKPKNYLDILSGECRALSERFRLSGEQSDMLREFVTDTAMKSWRRLLLHDASRARSRAAESAGRSSPARTPIMAMTISISISVNAPTPNADNQLHDDHALRRRP